MTAVVAMLIRNTASGGQSQSVRRASVEDGGCDVLNRLIGVFQVVLFTLAGSAPPNFNDFSAAYTWAKRGGLTWIAMNRVCRDVF
ncbi:MAG: hypothetical protein K2W33_08510 [Burkholderiales bacterium]|nr:hypothetical protein [Burkholderiales bacterium]